MKLLTQSLKVSGLVATLLFSAYSAAGHAKMTSSPDIVSIAASVDSFSTLVTAVQVAGLVETLQGDGPYTVLAPTNEAFSALPAATLKNLLKPENRDKLTQILTYHVLPGKVTARDAQNRVSAKTVQGEKIVITQDHGQLFINGAQVVKADIQASNGIIHVIDKVILPKG